MVYGMKCFIMLWKAVNAFYGIECSKDMNINVSYMIKMQSWEGISWDARVVLFDYKMRVLAKEMSAYTKQMDLVGLKVLLGNAGW